MPHHERLNNLWFHGLWIVQGLDIFSLIFSFYVLSVAIAHFFLSFGIKI